MLEWLKGLAELPAIRDAVEIWLNGGWAMIALALNAMILFAIGVHVWIRLRGKSFSKAQRRGWREWITSPDKRQGPIGRRLDFVMDAENLKELGVRFDELNHTELSPFDRDLKFMRRAVSTAPLLGLLGTVTGMLATFKGLAAGAGGDKTMDLVASGISEALITTETGLVIAIPGLFLTYHLAREKERYATFLSHLQSACTQHACSKLH